MDFSLDFFETNHIATRGYVREQYVPYPAYPSGARDGDNPIYNNPVLDNTNPLLLIEEDIIAPDGRGLRKGFYEVRPDIENNFLMLYQSGRLKAKAPILSVEQRKFVAPTKDQKKKKTKKNYRGINPEEFIYNKTELRYCADSSSYIIIWDRANTRIQAILKLF
ncbi:hypothetical protein tpqmel_0257 [Candidatus Gastranaerophilus sp. (ex Termes propinquus)]|nr:hypothetical protein tpqmel_0257 [Candidatus Gastranaerophilus sp. (ex Termes propinquus)]